MSKVHERFKGTPGTFAQFGDSITVTLAYWAPLADSHKGLSPEAEKVYQIVKEYLKPACWNSWKGGEYGSEGGMTIQWARDNVQSWLRKHNPETALIMFGTNDLTQLGVRDYEQKLREVVDLCLRNGTVVILSTIPPRSGMVDRCQRFNEAVRRVAGDKQVPLIDYYEAILQRRPDDWDGSAAQFKDVPGDTYDVPTLLSRDGVHPSYHRKYRDFSEESLKHNGYALRSYLTLMTYGEVLQKVLRPNE